MSDSVQSKVNSAMMEKLISTWERVLGRASVRPDDNFFDLGGTPASAAQTIAEIEVWSGRKLPRFVLYHTPTLRELAAVLEQKEISEFPKVVPLKWGAKWPPIYLAPGLAGDPLAYFPLGRRIQTEHSVFVMQAKGLDGTERPFERIEDIAQNYLNVIKGIQPHGPYLLIGSSLGGLVTLEMAQRIVGNGEQVGFLAMLESYPYVSFLSLPQRVLLVVRVLRNHVVNVTRLPLREGFAYITRRARRKLYDTLDTSKRSPTADAPALSPEMQRLRDGDYQALMHYNPRFYKGKVKFVRAAIGTHFPDDPEAAWRNLLGKIEVETVPGDHLGIVNAHYEELAAAISRYLSEAGV